MKVTPLDMRQQQFRRVLRGLDPAEVTAFLNDVADEYERALDEVERVRQELSRLEGRPDPPHEGRHPGAPADEAWPPAVEPPLPGAQAQRDALQAEIESLSRARHDVADAIETALVALRAALDVVRRSQREGP